MENINISLSCWPGCLTVAREAQISWGCEAEGAPGAGTSPPLWRGSGATRTEAGGDSGSSTCPSLSTTHRTRVPLSPHKSCLVCFESRVPCQQASVCGLLSSPRIIPSPRSILPAGDGHQALLPPRPQDTLTSKESPVFISESCSACPLSALTWSQGQPFMVTHSQAPDADADPRDPRSTRHPASPGQGPPVAFHPWKRQERGGLTGRRRGHHSRPCPAPAAGPGWAVGQGFRLRHLHLPLLRN